MQAEIITIGDEILIGQIVDTNSAWMATRLNALGIAVKQISSVSDDIAHILEALSLAESRTDIVLITGGLGPTKDDITKIALAQYFNMGFRMDEGAYAHVLAFFEKYNRPLLEVNKKQAEVPQGCQVIVNKQGTAPAMLFRNKGKLFISMPGVPFEMKFLMDTEVLPLLQKEFHMQPLYHYTILTSGLGESYLAEAIADIENALPAYIKLAYLPKLGQLRLRLSAQPVAGIDVVLEVQQFAYQIDTRLKPYILAHEDLPIEKVVLNLMTAQGLTLSTAESCTGGYIGHLITQHPGCSSVYFGGAVSYACSLKESILGVKAETLAQYGAVSEEVVLEMAQGARTQFKTDYAVAVSGVAGPDGGTPEKPIGMVWIAVAGPQQTVAKLFRFNHQRLQNIEQAAVSALSMLFKELKKIS